MPGGKEQGMSEYIVRETVFPGAVKHEVIGELVRCKDCKYHDDEEPGAVYCPDRVGGWVSEDFFCADGRRRE